MSEFWKRKMKTYIHTFDLNKDGVISKTEWLEIPARFAQNEKADKEKTEFAIAQFENVWNQLMKHATTKNKDQLTVEVLSDTVGKQRYNRELMKHYRGLVDGLVRMMDLNDDGYLQENEYETYLANCGIDDPFYAREAIRRMDVNQDGRLSTDEFLNAFFDFFFTDDEESPNAFFFGPLVD